MPRPVTELALTRARTTQKREFSERYDSASLTSWAFTITWARSLLRVISSTSPISTSLHLILVLPASSPSAVLKVIVISGPFSETAL